MSLRGVKRRSNLPVYFGIFVFLAVLIPARVFCYDTNIAHPNIAELAAKLYNEKFPNNKLSASDIAQIKLGATEEDTPTRWYNHFYDPIYNRGVWFRNNYETAKDWSSDFQNQQNFSLGDNSWQRAITDFQDQNRDLAMRELGHAIHLISDMFVPAHTRDDMHPAGDSYEQFVKDSWSTVAVNLKYDFQSLDNLNTAFYSAAKYSNGNFYSDDTVESLHYQIISPVVGAVFYINGNRHIFVENKDRGYLYGYQDLIWQDAEKKLNFDAILTSYSSRLLPKAIGYSAGMIDLFFREARKSQPEKLSWLRISAQGLLDSITGAVLTFAENGKDYLVQNVFGEEGENVGKEILRQVDIQMTAESQKLRPEIIPQKSQLVAVIPSEPGTGDEESLSTVTTTSVIPTELVRDGRMERSLSTSTNSITTTTPTTTYYYNGGASYPTPTVIQTSTPTSTTETPTTTPTSTPETPTSTPTTTPDITPPQIPVLTIFQPDLNQPLMQITATSTDASSTMVFFDFEISTSTPDNFVSLFVSTTTSTVDQWLARGYTYFFRARAKDEAGNVSDYSSVVSTTLDFINLSGEQISNERILDSRNSPYLANGPNCYVVPAGAKLTIEPGVKIQIAERLCLIINGELEAVGTADNGISFEQLTPGKYWGQIIFNSATGTIKFASITGGNREYSRPHESDGMIYAENSYLDFDSVLLDDVYEWGIDLQAKNGITKISNSIVADTEKSTNSYVLNSGVHVKSGELWLDNTQFRNLSQGVWGEARTGPDFATLYLNNMPDTNFTNVDYPYMPPDWLELSTTSTVI